MKIPQKAPAVSSIASGDQNKIELSFNENDLHIAKEFNSKYLHWDEVRRRDTGSTEPEKIWTLMTTLRENSIRAEVFNSIKIRYSVTEEIQNDLHFVDIALYNIQYRGMNRKDAKRHSVSSTMDESIASSQIEGSKTSEDTAKTMLKEGRKPKDVSEQMIFNNYKAMEYIKENRDKKLTSEFILKLHRMITENILSENESGKFRISDDIVVADGITGEVYHRPPSAKDVPDTMRSLCIYANDDVRFTHPIIKSIVLHFMIGYVHPFTDGNGRLARALIYWYALKNGYDIFEYLAVSKIIKNSRGRYDQAYLLSETDENDITYFIRYNMKCIADALNDFTETIETERSGIIRTESLFKDVQGLNLRQKSILMGAMNERKPFSLSEISSTYQTSLQTARTDVSKLEKLSLIKKHGKEWNKVLYVWNENKIQ